MCNCKGRGSVNLFCWISCGNNGTLLLAESENNQIKYISPENKILSVLELAFGSVADITVLNQTIAAVAMEEVMTSFILNISGPASLSIEKKFDLGYGVEAFCFANYRGNIIMAGTMPHPDMEIHPHCLKLIDQCGKELCCVHSETIDLVPGAYSSATYVTYAKHN